METNYKVIDNDVPAHKKRASKKPFKIEIKWRQSDEWSTWNRYRKEPDMKTALESLRQKGLVWIDDIRGTSVS